jgi:hypothetical protein
MIFKNGDILRFKDSRNGLMVKVTNIKKRRAIIVQVKSDAPIFLRELLNKESDWANLSTQWEKVNPLEVALLGIE